MAVTDYTVVKKDNLEDLISEVQTLIASGFEPQGSPLALPIYTGDGRLMRVDFYQAMIEPAV